MPESWFSDEVVCGLVEERIQRSRTVLNAVSSWTVFRVRWAKPRRIDEILQAAGNIAWIRVTEPARSNESISLLKASDGTSDLCEVCGEIYNIHFSLPRKNDGICDK